MAVKTKTQLQTQITSEITTNGSGDITGAILNALLDNIVDSYEDVFGEYTTVQRDALTPSDPQIIYNTDNNRYEFYDGTSWQAIGQTRHESPLYIKDDGNTDLTTDEVDDIRFSATGGTLLIQKYNGATWDTLQTIS